MLTAIIILYETTQIQNVVPPALLSHVVNFTEYVQPEALYPISMTNSRTLCKIHVCVKAKQGGRLKRLLNLSENGVQIKRCKAELVKHWLHCE
jgi:hypothetical protein